MYITVTASELSEAGVWMEYCDSHGIDYQRFSECGNWDDEFTLTPQEFRILGLSLAAHD